MSIVLRAKGVQRPVLVETLDLASVVLTRHYFGFGHCITNYPWFLDF